MLDEHKLGADARSSESRGFGNNNKNNNRRVNPCANARRRIPSAPVEGVMQGDPTVHTPIHRPVRHYMIQSGTCLTETVSLPMTLT